MKRNNLLEQIGNTPLMGAHRYTAQMNRELPLLVKCECFNPGGSIKDRAALYMITAAEQEGLIGEGGVIVEPTSGNTGIGLAVVAAQRGYRLILTMPDNMSIERRKLLIALGAELVLTPAKKGMQGAVDEAMLIAAQYASSFIPNQFKNPANAAAHYYGTAMEIWEETEGHIGALFAGIGSGGTITGCGKRLKELNPKIKIIGVEPAESPLLTSGQSGPHGIQGIGANFIPALLDQSVVDEVMTVRTEDAIAEARKFSASEGLGIGISSGAALSAALAYANRDNYDGQPLVAILPDGNARYMSTDLFI